MYLIVKKLIQQCEELASGVNITDVRVGIGYTAVLLENGCCGLTFTFRNELGPKCAQIEEAGLLIGKPCSQLLEWAMDINLVKSSIGLAVINGLLQKSVTGYQRGDVLGEIDIKKGDKLGIIGYYKPVIEKFANRARKVYIFERNITDDGILPDWAEEIYLPECDVVVISGTTLLNKTLDHILKKSENARETVIMGPTASLSPKIFKESGVTLLAGVKVTDPSKALRIVSQGGGGLSLGDSIEQVYLRLNG
jgi:uncharacterized protein